MAEDLEIATFANGCFWCTEAIFQRLKGVFSVTPGYTGGTTPNPTYEEVSNEATGHAEAIQIKFDLNIISYSELLQVFFATHDPTTLNRQGADVGTQYRSAIFYHSDEQKNTAEQLIRELQPKFKDKIATEVTMFTEFYKAEDYHKNYYNNNRGAAFCRLVIDPKIRKLTENFSEKLSSPAPDN